MLASTLFSIYTFSFKKFSHDVMYSKILTKDFEKYDCYILSSSIVCCEAEIRTINEIKSKTNKNIFVIGPFATNNPKNILMPVRL